MSLPRAIDIVFCVDDDYAVGAVGTARSIRATLRDRLLRFHVLVAGMTAFGLQRLDLRLRQLGEVMLHDVPGLFQPSEKRNYYDSPAALGRLYMGTALPETLSRAIYLDADTLVLEDLSRLYDVDLCGKTVGAVINEVSPRRSVRIDTVVRRSDLGAKPPGFFNSGVLVVDLKQWRAQEITQQAISLCERHANEFHGIDQEILNLIFAGHWTRLPSKWNRLLSGDASRNNSYDCVRRWASGGGILHYVGPIKPWHHGFTNRALLDVYRANTSEYIH